MACGFGNEDCKNTCFQFAPIRSAGSMRTRNALLIREPTRAWIVESLNVDRSSMIAEQVYETERDTWLRSASAEPNDH